MGEPAVAVDTLSPAQQAQLALAHCCLGTPMRATHGKEILRQMTEMEQTIKYLRGQLTTAGLGRPTW